MASQYSTTEGSKNSSSDEILHSQFPAPGHAARPSTSSSSADDESSSFTPPPKTDQQHKKDKKKKKQPSPPASITNKTAATKMSAKRRREDQQEEEDNGVVEPPTLKKTLHDVQQESPPKENKKKKAPKPQPVSTPHSPQKSLKKVAQRWNPKDELAFLNGLLAFCERGKGFPKSIAPVCDHIRSTLDNHFSNRQLSDKCSRWKAKFRAAQDKMKDNTFKFRNSHENAMYNICQQLWGEQEEGGAENEENNEDHSIGGGDGANVLKTSMNVKEKKKRRKPVSPKEKDGEEDMQKLEDQEYQGPMNGKEDKKKKKRRKPALPKEEHGEEDMQKPEDQEFQGGERDEDQEYRRVKEEEDEDEEEERKEEEVEDGEDQQERKEEEIEDQEEERKEAGEEDEEGEDEDRSKNEKAVATNMAQNDSHDLQFREEMNAMVAGLKNTAVIILRESELKSRAMIENHFNSRTDHFQSLNNERINGFHSARGALVLNRVKAEALEQKWREQQILEIEAYSKRLELLQEECNLRLEELKAPVRNGGY